MTVAIIPARGKSERIPRKNIKLFDGKPLIAWSILAALESKVFEEVIVSTDDEEIAAVANSWGANTPFLRPKELADSHTGTTAVIQHAAKWLENNKIHPKYVCCIYATAPLLRSRDLQDGLKVIEQNNSLDYVFAATSFSFPIQRALRKLPSEGVIPVDPKSIKKRSQDLEETYHDAGQFYWGTPHAWKEGRPVFSEKSRMILLPHYRVQDIDTPDDWRRAELLHSVLKTQDWS